MAPYEAELLRFVPSAPPCQDPRCREKGGRAEIFPQQLKKDTPMPAPKQVRAKAIVLDFLERDKLQPKIDPRSELKARTVGEPAGLWARITLDHRFDAAPAYGTRTERRPIRDKGWMAVAVYNRDKEVLVVNVREPYFHIAYYKPDPWEAPFGVDWEGDHQVHAWGDPPIGDHLEEQFALREKNLQLEPTRGHPRVHDELRTIAMRPPSLRKPEPSPSGPLTVTLQR